MARTGVLQTMLLTVVVAAATGAAVCAAADPARAVPEVTRRAKVDLLWEFHKRFGGPPQVIILGSSRAMRADPAQVRAALGLRAFNAAVSSGTVPDAYALLRLVRARYPQARPAVLWFLDVESLRLTGVHPYLLSVRRLARQLPAGVQGGPVKLSRGLAAGAAAGAPVVRPRWHKDGLLVSWWHDRQRAQGRTTVAGVRYHQRQLASVYCGRRPRLSGSAKWYAAQIVRSANEMGVTPVVVLTPYHPQLRAFLLDRGWPAAHRQVRAFLRRLGRRLRLRVVDLTDGRVTVCRRAGGVAVDRRVVDARPGSWYDGLHPRAGQMRRILRAVLRQAGDELRPGAATIPGLWSRAAVEACPVAPRRRPAPSSRPAPYWPELLPPLPPAGYLVVAAPAR